jgi:copper ion binding protein
MSAEAISIVYEVPSISCNHCKMAIEQAVVALDGIESVSVDVDGKTVAVRIASDRLDTSAVRQAIEEEGYQVVRETRQGS